MDTFTSFSLSTLTRLLPFRRAPVSIAERQESDIKCIVHARSDKEINNHCIQPRIFLPRLLVGWPWPRQTNPHYAMVRKEFDAWVANLPAFNPEVKDAYDRCDIALLSSMFYPTFSKDHARAGSDLMHVFIVIDEYSDRSTPSEVRDQKNIVLDALRNPHTPRPKEEWVGGEVTRQFWERTIRDATELMKKRFVQTMDEYFESVVQESINRRDGRVLDVKSYIELRRCTVATNAVFTMLELEVDMPEKVMAHPAIKEMVLIAGDLVILVNDMLSYNGEQMRGDDLHNIITCAMHEYDTDVNGAMLWTGDQIATLCEMYLVGMGSLPQWEEPLNSQVKDYFNRMAHVVRGNLEWSFESGRYFGDKGLEIRKNRWMSLLPKKVEGEIGPIALDSSLL